MRDARPQDTGEAAATKELDGFPRLTMYAAPFAFQALPPVYVCGFLLPGKAPSEGSLPSTLRSATTGSSFFSCSRVNAQ